MATLVCFHAHPDDEAIATGGVICKASEEGHRVVLVVATGGEHGEVPDDLSPGESLHDRRRTEVERSAQVLGIHRIAWLGYEDSGMNGWAQNDHSNSFWQADVEEAAARLAAILSEERADVVTIYDWHGNYGHPDHIKVHRVGHRAAELAETPTVYEATMNRDHLARLMEMAREMGLQIGPDRDGDSDGGPQTDDGNPFGMTEAELTTAIDVTQYIGRKREAIAAHRSQISDTSFFLQMPAEAFAMAFGTEWFIRKGAPAGIHESSLAGL